MDPEGYSEDDEEKEVTEIRFEVDDVGEVRTIAGNERDLLGLKLIGMVHV